MKTVLVPVEQHAFMRSVLDVALLVASRFGSHIEGFALGPDVRNVAAFDIPSDWTVLNEKEQQDRVEQSRELFESFMLSRAVPRQAETPERVSYSWTDKQLFGESHIGNFGRVFDLIVLGRPGQHHEPPPITTVEAALFESGRPVLLAAPLQ
jgi:hypothetical protein